MADPATSDTGPVLRFDVIDAWAARSGATSEGDVAELLELDRSALWRFRKGKRIPSLGRALRIAAIVGVPVEEIVSWQPEQP